MNVVEILIGPPGSGKSRRFVSYYIERWPSTPVLSKAVIKGMEELIHQKALEKGGIVFKVAFTKLSEKTYDVHLDVLEESIFSIFNEVIEDALVSIFDDKFTIPRSVLTDPIKSSMRDILFLEALKNLPVTVLEKDTIIMRVKVDSEEEFISKLKNWLEETFRSMLITLQAATLVPSLVYVPPTFSVCPYSNVRGFPLEEVCMIAKEGFRKPILKDILWNHFIHILHDVESVFDDPPENDTFPQVIYKMSDTRRNTLLLASLFASCPRCEFLLEHPDVALDPLVKFMLGIGLGSLTSRNYKLALSTYSLELILGVYISCNPQIPSTQIHDIIIKLYQTMGINTTLQDMNMIRSGSFKGNCELRLLYLSNNSVREVSLEELIRKSCSRNICLDKVLSPLMTY